MFKYRTNILYKGILITIIFGFLFTVSTVAGYILITKDDIQQATYEKLILSGELITYEIKLSNQASQKEKILNKLNEIVNHNDGYGFIVDKNDSIKILTSNISKKSLLISNILKIAKTTKQKNYIRNKDISYQTIELLKDPVLNKHTFGIIYTIPYTNWSLGLVLPYDKAFEDTHNTLLHLVIILLLVSIFTIIIGYIILKKHIINPILSISNQLKNNSDNILTYENIKTDSQDEIGNLVSILNNRTSSLKKHYSEVLNLQKEIEDTQKEVVFTMGAIGESRSKETGNHVKRVAEYSKILALKYGLDINEAEMLKQASPMHDIGKVAIPDAVLNKPGRFDEDERKVMDTHAMLGYEMLKYSNRPLLKMASIVAYEHHEKWDGTGYPQGTSGTDIHIYGRITALADVFDALGSDRVYKKAWNDEKIFQLFKEERGKHFDPKLIDLFFDNLADFLAVRKKFSDVNL